MYGQPAYHVNRPRASTQTVVAAPPGPPQTPSACTVDLDGSPSCAGACTMRVVLAYREHGASARLSGPPGGSAKDDWEGRSLPQAAHPVARHQKGKPTRLAQPPLSPAVARRPYTLTRNDAQHQGRRRHAADRPAVGDLPLRAAARLQILRVRTGLRPPLPVPGTMIANPHLAVAVNGSHRQAPWPQHGAGLGAHAGAGGPQFVMTAGSVP